MEVKGDDVYRGSKRARCGRGMVAVWLSGLSWRKVLGFLGGVLAYPPNTNFRSIEL